MARSKKRTRSSIRNASDKTIVVTYAYDPTYEFWVAPWGIVGQEVIDFAEGDSLDELFANATDEIRANTTYASYSVRHVVDTVTTPSEKQAEAAAFLVLKNA